VERHIRGKWACEQCETLIRASVLHQVNNKDIPTDRKCPMGTIRMPI